MPYYLLYWCSYMYKYAERAAPAALHRVRLVVHQLHLLHCTLRLWELEVASACYKGYSTLVVNCQCDGWLGWLGRLVDHSLLGRTRAWVRMIGRPRPLSCIAHHITEWSLYILLRPYVFVCLTRCGAGVMIL